MKCSGCKLSACTIILLLLASPLARSEGDEEKSRGLLLAEKYRAELSRVMKRWKFAKEAESIQSLSLERISKLESSNVLYLFADYQARETLPYLLNSTVGIIKSLTSTESVSKSGIEKDTIETAKRYMDEFEALSSKLRSLEVVDTSEKAEKVYHLLGTFMRTLDPRESTLPPIRHQGLMSELLAIVTVSHLARRLCQIAMKGRDSEKAAILTVKSMKTLLSLDKSRRKKLAEHWNEKQQKETVNIGIGLLKRMLDQIRE